MSFYNVVLPAGLNDAVYDKFEALLAAMAAGGPLPVFAASLAGPSGAFGGSGAAAAGAAAPSAPPAPEAAAGEAAGAEGAAKAGGGQGGFMAQLRELGQKAAQDTAALAAAIKVRGEGWVDGAVAALCARLWPIGTC